MTLVGLLGLGDLPNPKERFLGHPAVLPLPTSRTFLSILVRVPLIFRQAVEYLLDLRVDLIDILHPRLKLLPPVLAVKGWVLTRSDAASAVGGFHVVVVDDGLLDLSDLAEHRLFGLARFEDLVLLVCGSAVLSLGSQVHEFFVVEVWPAQRAFFHAVDSE